MQPLWLKKLTRRRTQQRRSRERIEEGKQRLGGICLMCKTKEQLQFHHVDPTTKEFDATRFHMVSRERWLAEVEKCVLLCRSCHTTLHNTGQPEHLLKNNESFMFGVPIEDWLKRNYIEEAEWDQWVKT